MEARLDPFHPLPRIYLRNMPWSNPRREHLNVVILLQDELYKGRNPDRLLPFGSRGSLYTFCAICADMGKETSVHPWNRPLSGYKCVGGSINRLRSTGRGQVLPRSSNGSFRNACECIGW